MARNQAKKRQSSGSRKGQKKMDIIEKIKADYKASKTSEVKHEEKKPYSEMTDAEKLKVKSEQLKKAKSKNKEQAEYIEYLEQMVRAYAAEVGKLQKNLKEVSQR